MRSTGNRRSRERAPSQSERRPSGCLAIIREAGDRLDAQLVERDDQEAGEEDFVQIADSGQVVGQLGKYTGAKVGQVSARQEHAQER